MKLVNASTVSPVSGGTPTSSASSTSASIGLKPRVQSSTPPSPWGIRLGGAGLWHCHHSAHLTILRCEKQTPSAVIFRPELGTCEIDELAHHRKAGPHGLRGGRFLKQPSPPWPLLSPV